MDADHPASIEGRVWHRIKRLNRLFAKLDSGEWLVQPQPGCAINSVPPYPAVTTTAAATLPLLDTIKVVIAATAAGKASLPDSTLSGAECLYCFLSQHVARLLAFVAIISAKSVDISRRLMYNYTHGYEPTFVAARIDSE